VSPCGPSGPSGPCGPAISIETPTETALAAKIAITIPAINFPIVIETAAIALTPKKRHVKFLFKSCISQQGFFFF
jgi:hypothetical protein